MKTVAVPAHVPHHPRRVLRRLAAWALAVVWAAASALAVAGEPSVAVPPGLTKMRIAPPLLIWHEDGDHPDPAAVAAWPDSRFRSTAAANLGLDSRPVWIRVPLDRLPGASPDVVLQLGRPLWRDVSVYLVSRPASPPPTVPQPEASAPRAAASLPAAEPAAAPHAVAQAASQAAAQGASDPVAAASAPPAASGPAGAASAIVAGASAAVPASAPSGPAAASAPVPAASTSAPLDVQTVFPLRGRQTAYRLDLPEGHTELLLRLTRLGAVTPVMTLWNPTEFQRYSIDDALLQGLFFGLLLALVIYNAFLFISTRDRAYLAYILWQGATMAYMLVETGLGQSQLWPRGTPFNDMGTIGGLMLMSAGGVYFMRVYLLLQQSAPRLDVTLQVTQWLAIALALVQMLPNSAWLFVPAQLIAAASMVLVAWAALRRSMQRFTPAAILLLGILPALVVGLANIGRALGLLPETFWTGDALQWALAVLALAVTYGLSVRVAQLRERAQRLQNQLLTDPLTGLLNRSGLFQRGQKLVARTGQAKAFAAVLWIDLDGLKRINDHFGHAAGDALIAATAARLPEIFGPDAACARLGGDEFAVVLPNLPAPRLAEDHARHALERLREPLTLSGQDFHSSASIGLAVYPLHGDSIEELLRCADIAMYRAKANGRDTFVIWDLDMRGDSQASLFAFTQPG